MQEIKITRAQTLKEKPDSSTLVFGKSMTDHMFIVDYDAGQGWHDPRIVPYAPLQIDPAAKVLHYAQEIFEGLKAYRTADGSIQLFRPLDNVRRMNDVRRAYVRCPRSPRTWPWPASPSWSRWSRTGCPMRRTPPCTSVPL